MALAVGIGWTFGYATIAVGRLNLLSTVFIIALIGIGMDYLVQILSAIARKPPGTQNRPSFGSPSSDTSGRRSRPPVFGTAAAFLVSVFTDFQGAAELGIIAGGGLLLCLLSGYTVLPALLTLFPRASRPKPRRASTGSSAGSSYHAGDC